MQLSVTIGNKQYTTALNEPLRISIPLHFNGDQANMYDVEKASSWPFDGSGFIGDTRQGGGCNFEWYKLCTHVNGTHTECVGHITDERISINEVLQDSFIPTSLITVQPEKGTEMSDSYPIPLENTDLVVTRESLEGKLGEVEQSMLEGVIIRTLPNDIGKCTRRYMSEPAPFLSMEAIQYLNELGVNHLILDLPSVDRAMDDGKLSVHHEWWGMEQGSHEIIGDLPLKTITEMAYISDSVQDGAYLLNIQIPDFVADAAPSRLFIYKLSH